MHISLQTLSYTLIGSGEGAGMIDSDVVLDELGIPYIPSRRIKGALKESTLEVCEMLGIAAEIVDSLFGSKGLGEGKISIANLVIEDYEEIKKDIKELKQDSKYRNFLTYQKISSFFTTIRQQTAIDLDKGIAKESSLRTLRVLKPELNFKGEIYETKPLSDREKALLYLAALNLKRIGTARNRGYGEISCSFEGLGIEEALRILTNKDEQERREEFRTKQLELSGKGCVKSLQYHIKVISPILIAKQVGEQNSVYTEKHIPGNVVRGLLAHKFINIMGLNKETAHLDKWFWEFFLNRGLLIKPAYPAKEGEVYYPAPLCLQKEKGEDNRNFYNVFKMEREEKKTKPVAAFCCMKGENIYFYEPETTFYFHNTRDRKRGSSIDGGIFYYEAVNADEEFIGEILGDEEYLKEIKKLFDSFTAFIGRSKTAQYGLIKFTWGEIKETAAADMDDEFIIHALSPIILYNDQGYPEVSEEIFQKYLEEFLGGEVEVINQCAKIQPVENFVGVWAMKSPADTAYAPGSSFEVRLIFDETDYENIKEKIKELQIYGLGEKTEAGFGQIRIYETLEERYAEREANEDRNSIGIEETVAGSKVSPVLEYIVKTDILAFVKYKGLKKAEENKRYWQISNHLLGRLEGMLLEAEILEDARKRIEQLEGKNAGDVLDSVKLWDELCELNIYDEIKNQADFQKFFKILELLSWDIENDHDFKWEISKTYWISFLRCLRLFKKQGDK
ncbi:RAMP superfamily CRISPR-associated protein [Thermosyntropha sp.]|uniref:RAMP superfamily CRISPR-associated protein n=1 Tax=Thermosyntropha sp. TaxID=2740820 RepID=UPI0025D63BA7|nr:RAMP superfamily CRISPR-associated protein [Thermosyntropha sp.]MBO8159001.1 hypothetical protein [Thermosyntropha sp.]